MNITVAYPVMAINLWLNINTLQKNSYKVALHNYTFLKILDKKKYFNALMHPNPISIRLNSVCLIQSVRTTNKNRHIVKGFINTHSPSLSG